MFDLPAIAHRSLNRSRAVSVREAAQSQDWDKNLAVLPSDAIALSDIKNLKPILEKKIAKGKEHVYHSDESFRILHAVVDRYTRQGTPIDYFESPRLLAKMIAREQAALKEADSPVHIASLLSGIVRISNRGHHAAIVARASKDEAAVMVIDSLPDLQNLRKRKKCLPTGGASAIVLAPNAFEQMMFSGFNAHPNMSVYFTYLGTQMSFSDCASFALLTAKNIAQSPSEQAMLNSLLAQRQAHLTRTEGTYPQIRRVVKMHDAAGKVGNTHFILDEAQVILPGHYIHAQSRRHLKAYCDRSPFVNDEVRAQLFNFHNANRRSISPAFQVLPRVIRKKANISIRSEQLQAIRETEAYLEERIAAANNLETAGAT